ncbi:MAG: CBS domain-containing protein [Rubritepida sp.]|nr:CBS domain-containing protein [Rubritepida sp.]
MTDRPMSEMIRNRRPLTLRLGTTVTETCKQMKERQVSAALVTDEDDLLRGIFTGRDAVRLLAQGGAADGPVEAFMTPSPNTMPLGCNAMDALRLMQDGGFRHVPVVNDGMVMGVVSWGDFRTTELDQLGCESNFWERI